VELPKTNPFRQSVRLARPSGRIAHKVTTLNAGALDGDGDLTVALVGKAEEHS
jgi:hypothetical protein